MTNDASPEGSPADDGTRDADSANDDWESTALKRVAARRGELQDAREADPNAERPADWEKRAIECLKRYFRTHC